MMNSSSHSWEIAIFSPLLPWSVKKKNFGSFLTRNPLSLLPRHFLCMQPVPQRWWWEHSNAKQLIGVPWHSRKIHTDLYYILLRRREHEPSITRARTTLSLNGTSIGVGVCLVLHIHFHQFIRIQTELSLRTSMGLLLPTCDCQY